MKKRYFKKLLNDLSKMPFIYHDLDGNVLNDFVDIDANRMDIETLTPYKNPSIISYQERLKENNKVLFIGNAGIGKTTFFRFVVLSIIARNSNINIFNKKERNRIIPVYIPLKVLDNNSINPIYNYILSNIEPLKRHKYLYKKANKGEIFLLLDGYDEISQINKINYIQGELSMILNNGDTIPNIAIKTIFHEKIQNCKIWLSSRKEFFKIQGLGNFYSTKGSPNISNPKIIGLELKGIGDNRQKLAKTIFDRYKKRNPKYIELLDEELFIRCLKNSEGIDINDLSQSPLFLTVIIYLYINYIQNSDEIQSFLINNYVELILKTIALLIKDLDEDKVRQLPKAKKIAYLQRRNLYEKEKIEFLKFFAAQLYVDNKTVFEYKYIVDKLLVFLEGYNSINKQNIISSLKNFDNEPNFIDQLIYCTLFTYAGRNENITVYDFPHRRFREVLASLYFEENEDSDFIMKLISINKSIDYSEFVYVFYKITKNKDGILEKLLDSYIRTKDIKYSEIAKYCVISTPLQNNYSKLIENIISKIIEMNSPINISKVFTKNHIPSSSFVINISSKINHYINTTNHFSLNCCLSSCLELNIAIDTQQLIQKTFCNINEVNSILILDYLIKQNKSFDYIFDNYDKLSKSHICLLICSNIDLINIKKLEEWVKETSDFYILIKIVKYLIYYKLHISKELSYLSIVYFGLYTISTEIEKEFKHSDYQNSINEIFEQFINNQKKNAYTFFINKKEILQELVSVEFNKKTVSIFQENNLNNLNKINKSEFTFNLRKHHKFKKLVDEETTDLNQFKSLFFNYYVE